MATAKARDFDVWYYFEVSEAYQKFSGTHIGRAFEEVCLELTDVVSNICTVAGSANIDLSKHLEKMYAKGCHVCHKSQCECRFSRAINIKT